MIIKKFQAKTENEAVEAAKKELGSNVVVMNVRNTKKKGLLSFLKPQLVEITVAVEEDTERKEPVKTADARSITEALGKIAPIVERSEKEGSETLFSFSERSTMGANLPRASVMLLASAVLTGSFLSESSSTATVISTS